MAKVRELLRQASVQVAKGPRTCHRNRAKHSIAKGERCLVVRDPSSGSYKNYCAECAQAIFDRAEADLDHLRAELPAPRSGH